MWKIGAQHPRPSSTGPVVTNHGRKGFSFPLLSLQSLFSPVEVNHKDVGADPLAGHAESGHTETSSEGGVHTILGLESYVLSGPALDSCGRRDAASQA